MELAVSVVVAAAVPDKSIEAGMLQVIGLAAAAGEEVTAQVRLTGPANPPDELTMTVDVLPVVLPASTLMPPARSEIAASVTETVVTPVEPV